MTETSGSGHRPPYPTNASGHTVECAICAAYGLDDCRTTRATAREILHDVQRDGLEIRAVYACPACVEQLTPEELAELPTPDAWETAERVFPRGEGKTA